MKPLIINHPVPMERVRVITLKDNSETVLKTLQKIGVLHIEEAKELKPVDREAIESASKEVGELLSFVTTILNYVPEQKKTLKGGDFEVIYTRPFREISNEVKLLYTKASALSEKINGVNAEAEVYKDLKKYLEVLPGRTTLKLSDLNYSGAVLFSRVFVLSGEAYKSAEERFRKYIYVESAVEVGSEVVVHAVAEAVNRKVVETMVHDAGGKILETPEGEEPVTNFLQSNDARIAELDARIAELKKDLEEKVGEDVDRLILLREALIAENDRLTALSKAAETKYLILTEGWVPRNDVEKVVSGVRENVDFAFVDSRGPESSEQPPTKMDNSAAAKPFQLIVDLFGTPKYREWDPTPIIAFSFAFFFGIMTQDVVYAIGIALVTKFLLPKFVADTNSESFKLFQRVLYTGAGVSLVIGLLSGSYLADFFPKILGINPPALPAVQQLFSNPTTLILAAVVIGFIHINIAHVFALILGIRAKNKGVVVAKGGLFLFELFTLLFVAQKAFNPAFFSGVGDIFLYSMYVSLGLLIIGIIMQNSYFGVLLWVFEITGLIGDALSYSRLAGVGLAGFYLGAAVNLMAIIFRTMIPGPIGLVIGTVVAISVMVLGHLINTVLSIQGGFIHSLRLCLVEFMFKFYEGGGSKYNPFSLKTSQSLIIKEKG